MTDPGSSLPNYGTVLLPESELVAWLELAHGIRILQYVICHLPKPAAASALAVDDEAYSKEALSTWATSYMDTAVEHLVQWTELALPGHHPEARDSAYFKPHLMLGRAGLECASQAVWVLAPNNSSDRVLRHLRLVVVDVQEESKVLRIAGREEDERALGKLVHSMRQHAASAYSGAALPYIGYRDVVTKAAEVMGFDPLEWEFMWRQASAAAHGRKWISDHAYDQETAVTGDSHESRVVIAPKSTEVTSIMQAALRALSAGVKLYGFRADIDLEDLLARGEYFSLSSIPPIPGREREKADTLRDLETKIEARGASRSHSL